MSKITTQKQVEGPLAAKLHSLGNNLYLDVQSVTSRQWLYIYKQSGKQRSKDLGSATGAKGAKITLAEARKRAERARAILISGKDLLTEAKRQKLTLAEAVASYVEKQRKHWRSSKTADKWLHSILEHANSIADRPMALLKAADLKPVIDHYWHRDAGRELRFRLEALFRENRSVLGGDEFRNPATLEALGYSNKRPKAKRRHHPAMPYEKAPAFVTGLDPARRGHQPMKLLLLTSTRASEVTGAKWPEFDFEARLWTIPEGRVKNGSQHIIPLTDAMMELLQSLPRQADEDRLFPGCTRHNLLAALKRIPGCKGYSVHGFRSTFRDWCGNETPFARDIVEETYGHEVGNDVERAYRRKAALKKRRHVLEAWNCFLMRGDKVVPLRRAS